jgi:anti-sigma regulatory factor (Ser/Thr protein kinase)
VSSSLAGGRPLRSTQVRVTLDDSSDVGEARRVAGTLARSLGFDEVRRGGVALAVTEAAANAVRHGERGEMLFRDAGTESEPVFEAVCLDRGPGMANVAESMRDGHSTGGTPGTGLGAMMRVSDFFDITSTPGAGTALVLRFGRAAGGPALASPAEVGVVCLPRPDESESGDAWSAWLGPDGASLLVADGLGHGTLAAAAAIQAVRLFQQAPDERPAELLDRIHRGLRSTRGAAAAVVQLDGPSRSARFAGIGNIAAAILHHGTSRSLVSFSGIVGHQVRKIQELQYPWPEYATLVMHSDGLHTHWKLDGYPGLMQRDPSLVAAVLYRDFSRERDDVCVLVYRPATTGAEH